MTNRGRRRAPRGTRTVRRRAISLAGCGALVASLTTGCFAERSAMPAVRDFLIAWSVGNYEAAADNTVGADEQQVADALGKVSAQLDAASLRLSIGAAGADPDAAAIVKDGDTAQASFSVKIDLGESGRPWEYKGHMTLKRVGGQWKVVWSPSIINPKLQQGQRLAVINEVPERALITDTDGNSMLKPTGAWQVGVVPGKLKDPKKTLDALAKATEMDGGRRLDAERLHGRVLSAPPQEFLPLMTLQTATHGRLIQRLNTGIPALDFRQITAPIAPKAAAELIGTLGPATSDRLQEVGAPYQPGDTIGVSGIQLLMQRRLAGTPTVSVVAQDPGGQRTSPLRSWPGEEPKEVRTTLDPGVQVAADRALSGLQYPASLVAVRPATGEVLAVSNHGTRGENRAFEGHYPPGMTFGVVSAEALFAHGQVSPTTESTCPGQVTVGGKNFTTQAYGDSELTNHLALSCKTSLAQLSNKIDAKTLKAEAARFGIGQDWGLQVPAFTGSVPDLKNQGELAAAMIGEGGVEVSPLTMALVAAAAQTGTWRPPYVFEGDIPNLEQRAPVQNLPAQSISGLQEVLKNSARNGTAKAAYVDNEVVGATAFASYTEKDKPKQVSWFIGSRGDVAVAIAVEGQVNAAAVAGAFYG
ncbi:penicillin-binding transpeptidase domain-containing protein [Actinomadura algeriensis]|uniref:Cell division protein FtsI/penicillin-binding protein 2 n=1 Tax=Actinomadura algeriensis TaxID=1679523 RepID=A0ABR9JLG8_9ACTN|nr:penicillin-binding transpeptidase domain-containing protein [Actinomadura algeriensis]MBE1531358.1 cell division protein FtsI/penicillin-binding protein 2 [Actinomadura algeriensis]